MKYSDLNIFNNLKIPFWTYLYDLYFQLYGILVLPQMLKIFQTSLSETPDFPFCSHRDHVKLSLFVSNCIAVMSVL